MKERCRTIGDIKVEVLNTIYFELDKLKSILDCAIEESDLTDTSNTLKNLLSISYDYTEKINNKVEDLLQINKVKVEV